MKRSREYRVTPWSPKTRAKNIGIEVGTDVSRMRFSFVEGLKRDADEAEIEWHKELKRRASKNKLKCPMCGSVDIATERQPNGISQCGKCNYKAKTANFNKKPYSNQKNFNYAS